MLNKLKEMRESLVNFIKFSKEVVRFNEITLADGSKLILDGDLLLDTPVYMLDESGNQVPVSEGNFELADGTIISVIMKEGLSVIGEITNKADEMPAENVEDSMDAPVTSDAGDISSRLDEMESKFQAQFDEIFLMLQELSGATMEMTKTKMSKIVELEAEVSKKEEQLKEVKHFSMKKIEEGEESPSERFKRAVYDELNKK